MTIEELKEQTKRREQLLRKERLDDLRRRLEWTADPSCRADIRLAIERLEKQQREALP